MTNSKLHRVCGPGASQIPCRGIHRRSAFAPSVAARENPENEFDFVRALELVEEDHLQILLQETQRSVAGRWPQIVAVASALLERQFLSALDIYQIIVKAR
jgi:hypothetical protein